MSELVSQTSAKPSKAEELFYFLKKLAGSRNAIDMEEVRLRLLSSTALSALYQNLKKLEELGAIERIIGGVTNYGRDSIAKIKFLKDEVFVPQGKRGRKPGSKNAKKEALPPVKVTAPQASPAPVLKQAPTLPPAPAPVLVPVCKKPQGVVVFIDENQVIALERDGRKLNFSCILEKVKKCAGEKIERVFFYCSEATERQNRTVIQSLFRLDSSLLRVVKTGSQPGVIDKRIREDVELWSRVDLVSTIVLATADGGPDFVEAITRAKNSGKKIVLLKLSGAFNKTLSQLVDDLIDASTSSLQRRPFEEIVLAAKNGNLNYENHNTQFVTAIAVGLSDFCKLNKEVQFSEIIDYTQYLIREIRDFDGFTEEDMREALDALIQKGQLFTWHKQFGKNFYRLTAKCGLLEVLEKKFPAHSRA